MFIALRLRTSAVRAAMRALPTLLYCPSSAVRAVSSPGSNAGAFHAGVDARRGCVHAAVLLAVNGESRVESSSAGQGHTTPAHPRGGSKVGVGIALL